MHTFLNSNVGQHTTISNKDNIKFIYGVQKLNTNLDTYFFQDIENHMEPKCNEFG